jgi:hypothetical protein
MSTAGRRASIRSSGGATRAVASGAAGGGHSLLDLTRTVYARVVTGPPCARVRHVDPAADDRAPRGSSLAADAAADALLGDLEGAYAAATSLAGAEPLGVRAVEWAPDRRGYLCGFPGASFLCLGHDFAPVRSAERAREIAGAGLLWEHLEEAVDPEALLALVRAIGRGLTVLHEPMAVQEALQEVATLALELVHWRGRPERVLASLVEIDSANAIQGRLHAAYALFVRASDPLVEAQDRLDPEVVDALREIEGAAAAAGVGAWLAQALADALPLCAEGADQIVAAHLTPLGP